MKVSPPPALAKHVLEDLKTTITVFGLERDSSSNGSSRIVGITCYMLYRLPPEILFWLLVLTLFLQEKQGNGFA